MSNKKSNGRNSRWGLWLVVGLIVAALCVGVLLYIGWFDNKTHIDSPNGDNVLQNYPDSTEQSAAPGENDWSNPDHSSLREIIVDHAEGTNTTPMPE